MSQWRDAVPRIAADGQRLIGSLKDIDCELPVNASD
jgi:hypothetical protein